DPIEAGYDIAISVGMPRGTSSSLIARKLNTSRRILCAAPDYLARRGTPRRPEDLAQHACLTYSYLDTPDEWHLIGNDGERVVKVSGPIVTSHREVLKTATVRVLELLPKFKLPKATIYAVYPAGQQRSAKVLAFNDFMTRYFAAAGVGG